MSDTYRVVVTRSDDAWEADVPDVAGAHTFARSLPSLIKSVREVIILMDDLTDDAAPELDLHYEVDDPTLKLAIALGNHRRELQARMSVIQAETETLAQALTSAGWSVRDAGVLLDITPGRVSQVAPSTGSGTVPDMADFTDAGVEVDAETRVDQGARHGTRATAAREPRARTRAAKKAAAAKSGAASALTQNPSGPRVKRT